MSNKFVLPTQKGTELFPQQTRIPAAKLRVSVDGKGVSPFFADQLGKAYANEINKFYLAQAQNFSLSTAQQLRVFSVIGAGARLTYDNQLGSEYLFLDVTEEALKRLNIKRETSNNAFFALANINEITDDVLRISLDDQILGDVDLLGDAFNAFVFIWNSSSGVAASEDIRAYYRGRSDLDNLETPFTPRGVVLIPGRAPDRGEIRRLNIQIVGDNGSGNFGEILVGRAGEYIQVAGEYFGADDVDLAF